MNNKNYLMNILIEYIRDVMLDNEKNIEKDYIYKLIINPNYGTDKKLEMISEDNQIYDNWDRYFKYDKNILVDNKKEYFSIKSPLFKEEYLKASIKLYIPMDKDKIEIGVKKIFDYIKTENIIHESKIFKKVRNDNIVIRVFDKESMDKIINFVNTNKYINSGMIEISPFVVNKKNIGLIVDYNCSYHNILSKKLYEYFMKLKKNNNIEKATLEDFSNYIKELIKTEKKEYLKNILNLIYDILTINTNYDSIIKYYNKALYKVIMDIIFDIYNINGYNKTIDIIRNYDDLINSNINEKNLQCFKFLISKEIYEKCINNDFEKVLNKIILKKSGYKKHDLDKLYTIKTDKLNKEIIDIFIRGNCYQEIKSYLKEYVNDEYLSCSNCWINNFCDEVSSEDVQNIIRKKLKTDIFNDENIELYINSVLIKNKIMINKEKKKILEDTIINTYKNREKNKEKFIKDALKQFILIDKINGFTNNNNCRFNVVKNIKPYECFYIIAEKIKDNMDLDSMINNYINSIMPYLSNKEYSIQKKYDLLNKVVNDLLENNTILYTIESLKLCTMGNTEGIRDNNKLIIEKCIGCNNILEVIKYGLNNNQEVIEQDVGLIIKSYVDMINNKTKVLEVVK